MCIKGPVDLFGSDRSFQPYVLIFVGLLEKTEAYLNMISGQNADFPTNISPLIKPVQGGIPPRRSVLKVRTWNWGHCCSSNKPAAGGSHRATLTSM